MIIQEAWIIHHENHQLLLPCYRLGFWIASQQSQTLSLQDLEAVAGRSHS